MSENNKAKNKKKNTPPRNPNKRPCVASNITFPIEREYRELLRMLSQKRK